MARSFLALLVVVVVVMLTAQTQAFSGMIVLFVCFFFFQPNYIHVKWIYCLTWMPLTYFFE